MPIEEVQARPSPVWSVATWSVIAILGILIGVWSGVINEVVTEPYLDEEFHVGQANKYLEGKYFEWDPKITTPPGLYVLSTILAKVTGFSSLGGLRLINALLLPCLILLVLDLDTQLGRGKLRRDSTKREGTQKAATTLSAFSIHQLHAAFNICLFPPLFFFSALYYTDIAAVVSVLLFWNYFLTVHEKGEPTLLQHVNIVILGLITLTFRQTNIFWVSVFPAAILLVSRIDVGLEDHEHGETLSDPPVRESYADEYFFFVISLASRLVEAVRVTLKGRWAYLKVVRSLIPYGVILAGFGAFVAWNGGVVLGDKSNHVATIHLPQMLYIWPYMTFFSFPLTYPYLLQGIFGLLGAMPLIGPLEYQLMFKRKKILPRPGLMVFFAVIAGVVIYYNTIVHPFTLADNRHYMFYVFRLLTRYKGVKFLVIPLYYMGAWAIIQSLGAPARLTFDTDGGKGSPIPKASRIEPPEKAGPPPTQPLRLNHAVAGEGAPVSFVLIWLTTSALQLITAPLVEPRYFILPWLMWRLRVPQASPSIMDDKERKRREKVAKEKSLLGRLKDSLWDDHDQRLWYETVWFLLINGLTGYVFLFMGFEWKQEPGRVQRFMW
ncbi:alpha-2-glucosyltransferase Alg10 [Elsinoe ampelina]|uniref:Dol-P-Glc:Glc(2)Man(9)GlcNAc(2)-PP-Dol alpha-1,2-glucosyltransferase n=1 Tax=Elsinoe ampelina TaxID=302913 RepID=A0A6A6G3V1_9PEZI|nr:alpha-2-glucosyltransferase Alg10 [Elsinoe ampelina]